MDIDKELKAAKKYALNILGKREYSAHDVQVKLTDRYNREISVEVLEWLEELGYLDDYRYGERLCSHLVDNKKYGRRLAAFELSKHGISREIIDELLEEYYKEYYIYKILQFLRGKYTDLDDPKELRRAVNGLIRRGHEYSHIMECVNILKGEE